jgi:hypothetical protein
MHINKKNNKKGDEVFIILFATSLESESVSVVTSG